MTEKFSRDQFFGGYFVREQESGHLIGTLTANAEDHHHADFKYVNEAMSEKFPPSDVMSYVTGSGLVSNVTFHNLILKLSDDDVNPNKN